MEQTNTGGLTPDSTRPYPTGLTRREVFAGWAMQALIREFPDQNSTAIAIQALDMADALIKELSFGSPNREGRDDK